MFEVSDFAKKEKEKEMNPTIHLISMQMVMVGLLIVLNLTFAGWAYQLKSSLFIQYACSFGFIGWAGYLALLGLRLLRIIL